MNLPKCRRCGRYLTSLSEINRSDGLCNDCYQSTQGQREETVILVVLAFIALVLLLFFTGAMGYF
jgi:hypothetical protein